MVQGNFLETPIEYLKGVGPARADLLKKELDIFTFGELLSWFPFRYIDRTRIFSISEIKDDLAYVQVKGKITDWEIIGNLRSKRLVATISDGSGDTGTGLVSGH
jgi:ATP-dependent DNA helicase RecG